MPIRPVLERTRSSAETEALPELDRTLLALSDLLPIRSPTQAGKAVSVEVPCVETLFLGLRALDEGSFCIRPEVMPLGDSAFDPLSIQFAARRWVAGAANPNAAGERDFALIDEKKQKTYRLRASDGGRIKTPAGRYDTLKIERVDDPKRGLRFWLARNADWIPVQVEHEKPKTGVFRMQLTALER